MLKKRIEVLAVQWLRLFKLLVLWTVIGAVAGVVSGFSVSIFVRLLVEVSSYILSRWWGVWLLPLALPVAYHIGRHASGYGASIEQVIKAIHFNAGRIPPLVFFYQFVATLITIGFGGSAGKAGPGAQIGAASTSMVADGIGRLFPIGDNLRRWIVVLGVSGGFSAVFGTPIAGGLFALEVLYLNYFPYNMLYATLVSGYSAYRIAMFMGGPVIRLNVPVQVDLHLMMFAKLVFAGILFGIVARLFIEIKDEIYELMERIRNGYIRAFAGGLFVASVETLLSRGWAGLSLEGIRSALAGNVPSLIDPLGKAVLTSVTLASGGSGGLMTPLFYVGATFGGWLTYLLGGHPTFWAVLGFLAVAGAAANAPLAMVAMAVELFGQNVFVPAATVIFTAFMVLGPRSVYPSQIVKVVKDPYSMGDIGRVFGGERQR